MDKEIIISIKSIIFFFIILFAIYLLIVMKPVILTLFIATIIVIAMEHPIVHLSKVKIMNKPLNRSTAVIVSYAVLVSVLTAIITIGVPPVVSQAQKLILNLAKLSNSIPMLEENGLTVSTLLTDTTKITENIFSTTASVFSGITALFSLLIISIYMSIDWINIKKRFYSLFHHNPKLKKEVKTTFEEIEVSLGHWIKGQLFLMVVIGVVSFIGLVVLDVEFPLALGLIAGLLEVVPVLGPVIAVVFAGIIGFSESFTKGMLVVGLFTLIQQLENNLLVPKVMHKVSGFSPLAILVALLVGSRLFGIMGAVIAVPVMMILVVIIKKVIRYNPTLETTIGETNAGSE